MKTSFQSPLMTALHSIISKHMASDALRTGVDALPIRSDAKVLGARLKAGETAVYALSESRRG